MIAFIALLLATMVLPDLKLDGQPLHYHGNVTIQKAFFFLRDVGLMAVLRLQ